MSKQLYSVITICGYLFLISSTFNSCIQEETFAKATVETNQVTSITEATAICGGIITADGGSDVITRGVCWDSSPNPTIENDTIIAASGTSAFSISIKGLTPGTTYYVRAYTVNKGGVAYGLNVNFTTKTFSIITIPINLITAISAVGGGNIISDGDSSSLTVSAHGVCWNTFPSPNIENSRTTDGVGGGKFKSKIDSLKISTTYYVRAYATNGNGTIYGNEVSFTTQSGVISLTTGTVSLITANKATCSGTITSDGGADVTERGLCWNTSPNPITTNNKTINGSGIGAFTADITELKPNTTYYVRSYAINNVATQYGNEINFSTKTTVTDIDGNIYITVKIGTQVWMAENLRTTKYNDGTSISYVTTNSDWAALSTPGYSFCNNDAANKSMYGALYNWYTVNTGKLAPTGWHVPTDAEWTTLENYLIANGYNYDGTTTENKIAKAMAAITSWPFSTRTGSTGNQLTTNNTSGFAGLPGGYRDNNGTFYDNGYGGGYWWTSTKYSADYVWYRNLQYDLSYISNNATYMQCGLSVRCVQDY